ncbi:MAG: hypothetical protein MUC35_01305 [Candidatus Margulisbacteria bacterium]|jgi:guanylate kinase|nr:hypothetical protein [Candidatus Margulisiibacteriota bacterium]
MRIHPLLASSSVNGRGGPVQPRRPVIIAISGYTGSGKSTIARKLVADLNFAPLVLTTTRPPAGGEVPGKDYHFASEDAYMSGLRQGEIIGCEGGYGAYYGVNRAQLAALTAAGKDVVVVVGASLMSSLRAHFQGRSDVTFRSVLVRLPGTPAERLAEISRRIEKRAREEGRDGADRLAKISLEALSAYDGRAPYYDHESVSVSGQTQALKDYVQAAREGRTTGKLELVPIKSTPEVLLARYLGRKLFAKTAGAAAGLNLTTYETNMGGIKTLLAAELLAMLRAIHHVYHGVQPPTAEREQLIQEAQAHILAVTSGIMQNRESLPQLLSESRGIGKLAAKGDRLRAERNIGNMLTIGARYSDQHLLLLGLLHDATKAWECYMHPERSYEFMDRLNLLGDVPVSADLKAICRIVMRHHIVLTTGLLPDYSAQALLNFVNDPEVRAFVAPAGMIDQARALVLLDSLFLLTIADISPYGAALTNLKFGSILASRNLLLEAFRSGGVSWQRVTEQVAAHIPALNRQYLGMFLGISDPEMDAKPGFGHYWQMINRRMDELIAAGKMTADEKRLLETSVHLVESFPYPAGNYLARVTPEGTIQPGLTEKPNAALFNFLLFTTRLAQLFEPGQAKRFCFVGANGEYVMRKDNCQAAALILAQLFAEFKTPPQIVGNRVYPELPGLQISINENGIGGAREINFRFSGIVSKYFITEI